MSKTTPTEAAPAYDDLFHERGTSSRNGVSISAHHREMVNTSINTNEQYAMVDQADTFDAHTDVEQGHRHHNEPAELVSADGQEHTHCAECDRQRERRERRESSQKSCGMVAKTFILIALFLMILGVVSVQAWKDVRMNKGHK